MNDYVIIAITNAKIRALPVYTKKKGRFPMKPVLYLM